MIEYRDATAADGPALDAMARAIWIETFAHSAPPADIEAYLATAYGPEGTLLRDLADPAIAFRLAIEDGAIVGYAKTGASWLGEHHAEPDARQLSQLYVASTHHGRGVAQALMRWTMDNARDAGARILLLTVWEENHRARAFYARLGFVHVGDYPFRTGSQIDRDMILRLAL